MGNKPTSHLPIHKYLNEELGINKYFKFDDDEELIFREICSPYMNQQYQLMVENNFKYILQVSDEKVFDILFKIFGRTMENQKVITFRDLRYFYLCFRHNRARIKMILIAFLIFQNEEYIKYIDFSNNIFKFFSKDVEIANTLASILNDLNTSTEKDDKSTKNTRDDNYYIKDFLEKMNEHEKYFKDFRFIKKTFGASKYNLKLIKEEKLNYVCDCANTMVEENFSKNYDSMKRGLSQILNSNNVISFKIFKGILKNANTHKNIINLVIDYLKKYTLRDYCLFEDFKYIFANLNYSLSLNDKKIFIFKMMLKIYNQDNKLSYDQISKYLDIDYEENKKVKKEIILDLFEEKEFLNNSIFEKMVEKLNPYLEDFGLIPYLYFDVKADDKKIKRRLIKDLLKNENIDNYDKYLENKFDDYHFFYAIDINFWNILMDEKEEAPDYINNSRIVEEIQIVKEEDKLRDEILKLKINIENKKDKKKDKDKNKKEEKHDENKNKEKEKKEENKNNVKSKKEKEKADKNKINKDDKNEGNHTNKNNVINEETIIEKNITFKEDIDDKKEEKANINKKSEKDNSKKIDYEKIISKNGNLKKGLKYKKDFFVLCGQLYQVLNTNYKQDYIIKLIKTETFIDLNKKNKNDNKKEKEEKDKKEKKEENKEENKEISKKEEKNKEENKENDEIKKENGEISKEKEDSKKEENNEIKNKNEENAKDKEEKKKRRKKRK